MGLSTNDLNQIAGQASTLAERIAGTGLVLTGGHRALAERRLAGWRLQAAANDPQRFATLLQTLGLRSDQEDHLLAMLGEVKWDRLAPLPEWVRFLGEMSESTAEQWENTSHGKDRTSSPSRRSLPYEELLDEIGAFAWKRLIAAAPLEAPVRLAVRRGLLTHLARRISTVTSLALHHLFLAHRTIKEALMGPRSTRPTGAHTPEGGNQRHYRAFVLRQGQEGLKNFFLLYPVAARLVAEITQFWLEATGEFLRRLDTDRAALTETFNAGQPLGELAAVHPGASDPHRRGRTVIILRFSAGLRLVYKPRPLRIDALFRQLVEHLTTTGLKFSLRAPEVLDRGEYGWTEHIRHEPCADEHAARRFYRRAGSLTGLVHWLRGVDCYRDNFVAAGEYPVLVDHEALGHPDSPPPAPSGQAPAGWQLDDSALRTGLLPYWQSRPDGETLYDNTALGAPTVQPSLAGSLRWKNLNTDEMTMTWGRQPRRHPVHRPRLGNRTLAARRHAADILAGYGDIAVLLDGPAGEACNTLRSILLRAKRRHIKRPTAAYAMLLRRSLRPEFLGEGIDRSLALHGLPGNGPMTDADLVNELASLEWLDVPYFHVGPADEGVESLQRTESATADFQRQREVIRASLNRRLVLAEGFLLDLTTHRKFRSTEA